MCGIAGLINYKNTDLTKISKSLHHRGPDDQTVYTHNNVALIHTRLAIQDVQHGIQPFHHEQHSIIFNGEIYNHQELRKNLKEFNFKTNSDTETLLYLYIKYKFKLFDMLDGMFAFCIYDNKTNQMILARDRVGKKPLYYYQTNETFIFASELNAIKSITTLNINSDAINCYLRTGLIWKPYTPYDQVFELEAGSYLLLDTVTLQNRKGTYFNMLNQYQNAPPVISFDEAVSQLETKLTQSISDRIAASDVEVGVFLSGGIDSNLIAALAAQIKPQIKTFTVKFDGLYDESALARLTADKYQTDHIELSITGNLKDDIEKIILSYGEPFMDSSAIPSNYVSKEASKHVKVVLGGDGADELFAGYRRYVPTAHSIHKMAKFFTPALKYLSKPKTKQSIYNYLYRLLAMSNKAGLDFYLSATTDVFEDVYQIESNSITNDLNQFVTEVFSNKALTSLNKMLYTDFSVILFCDLLVKMDIASMANSLEVRSPFLSKHLLEFAPGLPDKFKINKLKTKYILRKLAEKHLPQALVNQPKRGFEVPLKKWIDDDLKDHIKHRLSPGSYVENFIDKNFIKNLIAHKVAVSPEKRAKMLWSLYCLEVWYQNEA